MDTSKFHDKKEVKKFSAYLGAFLLLIGLVETWFGKSASWYFYLGGLLTLAAGFFLPIVMKPVFIVFSYIGFYLGKINSTILLTAFFYLFIAPIGFLLRLFKKDILQGTIKKEADSYWIKRTSAGFKKEDFKNQF